VAKVMRRGAAEVMRAPLWCKAPGNARRFTRYELHRPKGKVPPPAKVLPVNPKGFKGFMPQVSAPGTSLYGACSRAIMS